MVGAGEEVLVGSVIWGEIDLFGFAEAYERVGG
jgi:hypothetical protein